MPATNFNARPYLRGQRHNRSLEQKLIKGYTPQAASAPTDGCQAQAHIFGPDRGPKDFGRLADQLDPETTRRLRRLFDG
jgi:hypothetical protein